MHLNKVVENNDTVSAVSLDCCDITISLFDIGPFCVCPRFDRVESMANLSLTFYRSVAIR